jgi:hypothetical protein
MLAADNLLKYSMEQEINFLQHRKGFIAEMAHSKSSKKDDHILNISYTKIFPSNFEQCSCWINIIAIRKHECYSTVDVVRLRFNKIQPWRSISSEFTSVFSSDLSTFSWKWTLSSEFLWMEQCIYIFIIFSKHSPCQSLYLLVRTLELPVIIYLLI